MLDHWFFIINPANMFLKSKVDDWEVDLTPDQKVWVLDLCDLIVQPCKVLDLYMTQLSVDTERVRFYNPVKEQYDGAFMTNARMMERVLTLIPLTIDGIDVQLHLSYGSIRRNGHLISVTSNANEVFLNEHCAKIPLCTLSCIYAYVNLAYIYRDGNSLVHNYIITSSTEPRQAFSLSVVHDLKTGDLLGYLPFGADKVNIHIDWHYDKTIPKLSKSVLRGY